VTLRVTQATSVLPSRQRIAHSGTQVYPHDVTEEVAQLKDGHGCNHCKCELETSSACNAVDNNNR
jgi:hypothetical protein